MTVIVNEGLLGILDSRGLGLAGLSLSMGGLRSSWTWKKRKVCGLRPWALLLNDLIQCCVSITPLSATNPRLTVTYTQTGKVDGSWYKIGQRNPVAPSR